MIKRANSFRIIVFSLLVFTNCAICLFGSPFSDEIDVINGALVPDSLRENAADQVVPPVKARDASSDAAVYEKIRADIEGCLCRLDRYLWSGDWESAEAAIVFIEKKLAEYPQFRKELGWRIDSARSFLSPATPDGLLYKKLLRLEFYLRNKDLDAATQAVLHLDREFKAVKTTDGSLSAEYLRLRKTVLKTLGDAVRYGFAKISEKEAGKNPAKEILASINWTEKWADCLRKIGSESSRPFFEHASEKLEKLRKKYTVTEVEVPYLAQANNAIAPYATCQNTSLAMVLRSFGWKGYPDDITARWDRYKAQYPTGGADIFNTIAQEERLPVRAKGHICSYAEFQRKLANGYPMVVYGYFTGGHVIVVNSFNGSQYDVNDPAGKWNLQAFGGYTGPAGAHQKYPKSAFDQAVSPDGMVYCIEFQPVVS